MIIYYYIYYIVNITVKVELIDTMQREDHS